jgi:hypothetical protein
MAAAFAALLMATGCDDAEPATEAVRIEPTSVALRKGESATFTASGGYEYTWSIAQGGWGFLSNLTGPTVTYTSLYDPSNLVAAVQVLSVISSIPDAHRAETNAPPINGEVSAEAHITHVSGDAPI